MKKVITLITIIILISITIFGCQMAPQSVNIDPDKINKWSVNVTMWYTTNSLQDTSHQYHYPASGYLWLVVELSVTNMTDTPSVLKFNRDIINYIDENGTAYEMRLRDQSIDDALSSYCGAGKTTVGKIFFEVPDTLNVNNGKLFFDIVGDISGEWFFDFNDND